MNMYKALIMLLFNLKDETYHPIFYLEHPFPGKPDNLFRFRSKGHRTTGFKNRQEALDTIQSELIDRLPEYVIYQETEVDLPWDGENIPADHQLRDKNWIDTQEPVYNGNN